MTGDCAGEVVASLACSLTCTHQAGGTVHGCAMNCSVCILLLHALHCRGGSSGESEDDLREMMSIGSGSQLLLCWGEGGEDLEGEGRKRDVIDAWHGGIRDEECQKLPACRG